MKEQRQIAIAIQIDEYFPQHQEVFTGVQRYIQEQTDWKCIIDEHPMCSASRRNASYRPYDGVIARATPKLQNRLKRLGVPLVNVQYQTKRSCAYGVYPDAIDLGRDAAEHLIERGFRRLYFIMDCNHLHSIDICRSFQQHAESLGVTCETHTYEELPYIEEKFWLKTKRQFDRWLDRMYPPAGIFFENAAAARLMIQQCQARGWDVPRDVALLCQHTYKDIIQVPPQLSSAENNYNRIGYEAARMLDRLMSGKPVPNQEVFIPARGIVGRETTDFFAVDDPLVSAALRYIAGNLGEPLHVGEIAFQLAVSKSLLQLRFNEALGRGVSEEIRRLRLALVKRMLAKPDRLISEIAVESGFGRPQLLSAVFRREEGMTPSEYRKQVLGEKL